jgi:hypothetical protein
VLLALKSGACSRMRGMRDSMVVLMLFPLRNLVGSGFRSVVCRLAFQARGNPRRWPAVGECLSYVRIRGLRVELETHPQRAAATATATERAGMVKGGCHVSSRKQRDAWLQLVQA